MKNWFSMGETLRIFVASILFCLLVALINFLHKVWWMPRRIQHVFFSQGIKGPPPRFLHGNTIEISEMRQNFMNRKVQLSHDIFRTLQPHIYLWTKIYGKNFLHWPGARAELVVSEPELIKELLYDNEQSFCRSDVDRHLKKILGKGILTSDGEKWLKLRKLSSQAFHAESLRHMIPAMIESVELMLGRWKNYEGMEIDASEEFRVLTAEVISRTACGSSYLEGQDIFQMLRKLVVLSSKNSYKTKLPIISSVFKDRYDLEADKLEKRARDSVLEMVKKRQKEISSGEDFLGLHLKAHYASDRNSKITVQEIIDQCKTFYSAGQTTASILLSWTILLLAIHTEWQEKAREEVFELFGQQPPNPEGISRLKTMSMIINESLRLYPPSVYIQRKAKKGAKLGKLILPTNTNVHVPILAIHHDPKLWGEDAHIFNPERFSSGVAAATKNNPAAFLPFSLGPRTCVGANFATLEAKISLSMILQRYTFTLSPNYVHSPVQILSLRPQHGVQVVIRPR
ncbi:cytochrome P450 CYP749A22-like isoform X1 [Coffea eugenioides]|uniref:cytochrome P450 CYP749A22-like isoform X1 n=1 Tax=Coffea eugenioides TaxID=49369 RepID=UPI000F6159EB|nr:cytochrome P450 CYP749A22-like isoform X1 [Coffea eugenioides]